MSSSERYYKPNVVFRNNDTDLINKINEARGKLSFSSAIRNLLLYIVPNYSIDQLKEIMNYEAIPTKEE